MLQSRWASADPWTIDILDRKIKESRTWCGPSFGADPCPLWTPGRRWRFARSGNVRRPRCSTADDKNREKLLVIRSQLEHASKRTELERHGSIPNEATVSRFFSNYKRWPVHTCCSLRNPDGKISRHNPVKLGKNSVNGREKPFQTCSNEVKSKKRKEKRLHQSESVETQ